MATLTAPPQSAAPLPVQANAPTLVRIEPPRGPISWNTMIHNQFTVAPRQMKNLAQNYLFHRHDLMRQIEQRDIDQMKKQSTP